jgi:hypothetical protein
MKCKDCKFFEYHHKWHDMQGYGDCKSKKIFVWRKPLIHLKYCEEFSISENFGCIYGKEKE